MQCLSLKRYVICLLSLLQILTHSRVRDGIWLTPENLREIYAGLKVDQDGNGKYQIHLKYKLTLNITQRKPKRFLFYIPIRFGFVISCDLNSDPLKTPYQDCTMNHYVMCEKTCI